MSLSKGVARFEVVVAANGSGTAVDLITIAIAIAEVLVLDPDASFENQAGGGLKLRADEGTLAKKSVVSGSFWMDGYYDDGLVVRVVSDRLDDDCALLLCAGDALAEELLPPLDSGRGRVATLPV